MSKVNREEFARVLETVSPGMASGRSLSTGGGIENSTCFVFHRGQVSAYNDEVCCRAPSGLGKELTGAVEGKPLLEMLRKWSEEEIDVTAVDGKLVVKGKRQTSRHVMEAEIAGILDHLKSVGKPAEWKPLHADFCEAVSVVHHCCGKDETKVFVNFVHVQPKFIEARDDSQLIRWPMKTGFAGSTCLRKDAIRHVAGLGLTEFWEGEAWVHFRGAGGLTFSCRRYVEDYPDMTKHLDGEGERIAFPKGLVEKLDNARTFTSENDADRVLIKVGDGRAEITGQGVHGEYRAVPKVNYDGPPLAFMVAPEMLAEIVKEHGEVVIGKDHKLRVRNDKYRFVCCLIVPEAESSVE